MLSSKYFETFFMVSVIITMCELAVATTDLNIPQLEFVANHLRPEECRRLIAALEDPGFDLTLNLNVVEGKVPLDVPCLNLLVHWNSAAGEGRGKTHHVLSQRLKDIGHEELADWLSQAVFRQLSHDVNKSFLTDPLAEMTKVNDSLEKVLLSMTGPPATTEPEEDWTTLESVMGIIVLVIMFSVVMTVGEYTWKRIKKKRRKNNSQKRQLFKETY